MYNPNMHSTYWDIREAISAQYPDYKWNFDALPFGLTTINFGPQTVCDDHIDDTDNAFGLAPTRSFGPFDYKKGGHLVFPSLKLAVQFCQGTEAWIPTAMLPHANTQIGEDETRYSVTSYNSGGMSEWVYRGGLSKRGWLKYLKDKSRALEEAGLDVERPGILRERLFPQWT
ncbi:hypothetical protein CYLTODRAFT_121272 [Cylindrobasidium torrendii FP15055 ss-10]|uniref:Uncharacterized protein n=1 Tax=Cylindrobasidium torrendii FP15055 ss-10 TaxID=1314674 RepID=A0A0D7B128_9AGAR|nr:hypothetical protein CYLTODRAFT_121272 [Cylindrobasidium torrendii FP15055 ss-10]